MLKWKGFFEFHNQVVENEILASGLNFLGGVLTGDVPDRILSIRLESSDGQDSVTLDGSPQFSGDGGELIVETKVLFAGNLIDFEPAFAFLVSSAGVDIARAAVNVSQGQSVEVTRKDVFTVNQ